MDTKENHRPADDVHGGLRPAEVGQHFEVGFEEPGSIGRLPCARLEEEQRQAQDQHGGEGQADLSRGLGGIHGWTGDPAPRIDPAPGGNVVATADEDWGITSGPGNNARRSTS
ncbi:MAG: hypothetical protein ACRBN8_21765 [Nannocystales bacterium]